MDTMLVLTMVLIVQNQLISQQNVGLNMENGQYNVYAGTFFTDLFYYLKKLVVTSAS